MAMSCGVGCRRSSDPMLLWLWHRPEATALTRPLVWEPPYTAGSGPRKGKRTKKKDVVFMYSGMLSSHQINEIMPLAAMCTELEIILEGEVIRKRKTNAV